MNIKELITLSDIYAPMAYADWVETDWGVMFYDDNNPTKHDINHACILNNEYIDRAFEEVRDFYMNRGLTPRIYLMAGQKEQFEDNIKKSGFHIYDVGNFTHLLLTEKNLIPKTNKLDIIKLTSAEQVSDRLLKNIYEEYMEEDPDTINRMSRMLKRCIVSEKCGVYVGYFRNEPVTMAMTVKGRYGMQFFDLVETGAAYRGQGFARELISYLVEQSNIPTFLYSDNPTAIRIYEQAGFRTIDVAGTQRYWRAVYE